MSPFLLMVVLQLSLCTSFAESPKVVQLKVDGIINTGTLRYFSRGLDWAAKHDGALIFVTLNTPGGLLSSTREMIQAMAQSSVPVGIYVTPSGAAATSAGTILTMAAHHAGMAPGTNIGAAHPVGLQGETLNKDAAEKAVNDTVALIRAQAVLRGRNADWAEQAIRQSSAIEAPEAVRLHVVDFMADHEDAAIFQMGVAAKRQFAGLPKVSIEPTRAERLLSFLGDPNISYLLMLMGGLGIYVEVTTAGAVLPGVVGLLCLILSLVSLSTLPVNVGAVALIGLGLLLFLLELFIPSYGTLTIGALISLFLGALFLIDPSTGDLRLSMALVLPTLLAFGAMCGFLAYFLVSRRQQRSVSESGNLAQEFVDYLGVVQSVDRSGQAGKCLIRGEVWNFQADSAVSVGDPLVVQAVDQFVLKVHRK